jgi:hypothetical protein
MKKRKPSATPHQQLSFQSTLENIAAGMEYYALSVPAKITQELGTVGPVPVAAQVNGSETFIGSLYPMGGGRHYLRVRNQICKSVGIKKGDRVTVQITDRDLEAEIAVPKDVAVALRAAGVKGGFDALPIGKRSFLLRMIDKAVKPETRAKRIQEAVEEARLRQGPR